MTGQQPLFLPGWETEPCDTAEPPPPTRSRHGNPYAALHEPEEHRAYRKTVTVGSVDDYQPQGDQP